MLFRVSQPLPLDEAIQAVKRDPRHPVRVRIDEELTIDVRAVAGVEAPSRSVADVLREVGRWEGETGEELDALFSDVRQRSNRPVADLP
jgi:Arc/MetJ family transcription regulator